MWMRVLGDVDGIVVAERVPGVNWHADVSVRRVRVFPWMRLHEDLEAYVLSLGGVEDVKLAWSVEMLIRSQAVERLGRSEFRAH
jgi:hypothetical protein